MDTTLFDMLCEIQNAEQLDTEESRKEHKRLIMDKNSFIIREMLELLRKTLPENKHFAISCKKMGERDESLSYLLKLDVDNIDIIPLLQIISQFDNFFCMANKDGRNKIIMGARFIPLEVAGYECKIICSFSYEQIDTNIYDSRMGKNGEIMFNFKADKKALRHFLWQYNLVQSVAKTIDNLHNERNDIDKMISEIRIIEAEMNE
ncbi:MAG: hypothetical protein WDA06_03055 [Phenylobacterium sp.]